jgi:hypothetical protein
MITSLVQHKIWKKKKKKKKRKNPIWRKYAKNWLFVKKNKIVQCRSHDDQDNLYYSDSLNLIWRGQRNDFFFTFVMLLKWQLSISIFSQIWQYSNCESWKILSTLLYCKQLWKLFDNFSFLSLFFFSKKQEKFVIKYYFFTFTTKKFY